MKYILITPAKNYRQIFYVRTGTLYTKGLEHGKAKQFFDNDQCCFLKMYVYFIRCLLFSRYIPLKKKYYLPVIIPVNAIWMIRAYLAQVIFLLPKDHPLRKAMRSNALSK